MGCSCTKSKYRKIKELAYNNFVISSSLDKKEYALKIIRPISDTTEKFDEEIKILKKCYHPNIVQLKGVFICPQKKILYIITEYADDGNLQMKLDEQKKKGEPFKENQLIDWLMQICLALEYIHSKNIIHRKIKPSNIFCMNRGYIKLGDFGFAKLLENQMNKTKTFIDNMNLAPEIINKQEYSYEIDIWDLGVTFYQLMYFQFPFEGNDIKEVYDNILKGEKAEKKNNFQYSSKLTELIDKMLSNRKEERPKIKDILNDNLIKSRMESYLIENEFKNDEAYCEIMNYENKNKNDINKEMNESVLLTAFDYDDEIDHNFTISPENEKLNEEKNNYQYLRVMSLINEKYIKK